MTREPWDTDHRFLRAFGKLLAEEGGFVDHEADRGGRTMYGISERSHPEAWEGGPPSLNDAARIYWSEYWQESGADRIRSWAIAHELFNTAVLQGAGAAVRILQEAVNVFRGPDGQIGEDGRFGPQTRAAVNDFRDPEALAGYMNLIQGTKLLEIILADPSQRVFARGWLRRVRIDYGGD